MIVLKQIKKRDVVLYHPYDRFQAVLNFIDQAARDPKVVAINKRFTAVAVIRLSSAACLRLAAVANK